MPGADAGGEKTSSVCGPDEEAGDEAKGSLSDSESAISTTAGLGAGVGRLSVVGAGAGKALGGDLIRFGEARVLFSEFDTEPTAEFFLSLPRGRFPFSGASSSLPLVEKYVILARLLGASASAVSKSKVAESFLGRPRGRLPASSITTSLLLAEVERFLPCPGCFGGAAASVVGGSGTFLGRPLGLPEDAACLVDMDACATLVPVPLDF
jgi:hypothetical protein